MQDQQQVQPAAEIVNFPKKVKAFGREYEISRFAIGKLIRAAGYIAPLGYLLRSAQRADVSELLVQALSIGGEPAVGLLSVITGESVAWLEDKDPIEGLELLTETIEANASYFFDSANLDRIKAAFARVQRVIDQHAPPPISGESAIPLSEADMAH